MPEVIEDDKETPEEAFLRWERSQGTYEFYRAEMRHTRNDRTLDCHCRIPARMEYRYSVAKVKGVPGLIQVTTCDFHMRDNDKY
jgi:hypothetical protein